MKKEEINAFLDAVDRANDGDKNAFDGMSVNLDGEESIVISASGPENKKERKNPK